MPRKSKDSSSRRWRPALVALALAAGVLLAFDWLGGEALRRVGFRDRYRVAFADIRCEAPPGVDRPAFLTEVRYVSNHPESFLALDDSDHTRLERAFALHPWVESVDGVTVEPGNIVTVKLKFRTPVLA